MLILPSTKQSKSKKEVIYIAEIAPLNDIFSLDPRIFKQPPDPYLHTLQRESHLLASGTQTSSNIQSANIQNTCNQHTTLATVNPSLLTNTSNMSHQNLAQQGTSTPTQSMPDPFGGITNAEIDAFMNENPDIFGDTSMVDDAMASYDSGAADSTDFDFDFESGIADIPQVPAPAPMAPLLPPNTKGPYFDPGNGWHVKSTLAGMTPLPPPTDANFTGPFYDPETGWFYKMMFPPGAQPMAPMPFAMPQAGFTPMSGSAFSSAVPSGIASPVPMLKPPTAPMLMTPKPQTSSKPKRKPKYGPAAYLAKNQNISGSNPPRAVSVSEATFTTAAKQRAARESPAPPAARSKQPSIVQVCVCSSSSNKLDAKVKRPKNAFILYRTAQKNAIMKQSGNNSNQNVSSIAGVMWKNESAEVKAHFTALAKREAAKHARENPGYKYQPGMVRRAKFGSASCTCGAFQVNMAALKARRASKAVGFEGEDGNGSDSEGEEDEIVVGRNSSGAYVPPASSRTRKQPPHMALPSHFPQAGNYGYLPASDVQGSVQTATSNNKRKRGPVEEVEDSDPTLTKRLRGALQNVNYAEASETEIEGDLFVGSPSAPLHSPPAQNIRAQSKARNSHPEMDHASFLDQPNSPDWNELFGESVQDLSPTHGYGLRSRRTPPF